MWNADDVVAELTRRGELWEPATGLLSLRGDVLSLFRGIESLLSGLAQAGGFEEWQLAPGLSLESLARARYFESFPQWLTAAGHLAADEAELESIARSADPAAEASRAIGPARCALSPALCYHAYARLAGATIASMRLTAQGTCWRHEGDRLRPLERGWSFTMRELVFVGSAAGVQDVLRGGRALGERLAAALALDADEEPAADPFFAPTARGRALLQQVKGLKHELLLDLGGGRRIAAASFNDHEQFFGTCFDIRQPDGQPARSGCIAFGLERWLLAFLVAHGPDARRWPAINGMQEGRASAGPAPGGLKPAPPSDGSPLYHRHAHAADRGSWSLERDVAWHEIDPRLALTQPELLGQLRDAALIESFHPVNLARLMRACWDDVDAGVCLSIEAFEGFRHFHALRRYLDQVGFEPRIEDEELVTIRRGAERQEIEPDKVVEALVQFMLSEHLAAFFFRRLADHAVEPVLSAMLHRIAADEVRHAQSASDLIARRLARDASLVPRVLDAAAAFRHYGAEVVSDVPVAMAGDTLAIRTFAERIERLCGVRLVDHLKERL